MDTEIFGDLFSFLLGLIPYILVIRVLLLLIKYLKQKVNKNE